ncbi:MAG: DapH/DapD/GlmU-related protein [Bryobacteraceae bacterium]
MELNALREVGLDVTIFPLAKILSPGTVTIGSHVIIDDFVFIGAHRQLVIGNHVHIASHASITGGGVCALCDFAGVSSGVRILTGTDDFLGEGLAGPTIPPEFRRVRRGRVILGRHALIGANAVIFPDIEIGEGAAVGAGSVVTKNLAPWGVYVGSPARRVAARASETILRYEAELLAREGPYPRCFPDSGCLEA